MLRIAVCDDDEKTLTIIKKLIYEVEADEDLEFIKDCFLCGEDLCSRMESVRYDIICLDIVMGAMSGVETAEKIREMDSEALIIFISSYDGYLRSLFGVKAFGFVDKPINTEHFKSILQKAYSSIVNDARIMYTYTYNKITKWVYIKDICYFENNAHLIKIHLKDSTVQYYDTMSNVWDRVKGLRRFVMPSISFVVNIDFIEGFNASSILLKNGEEVSISRRLQEQVSASIFENIKEWSKCLPK